MTRVVVTGLGVVTPFGSDLERVWERLLAGEPAIDVSKRFGAHRPPTKAVGEVPEADCDELRAEFGATSAPADLRTVFGVAAARRALAHAGIAPGRHLRAGAVVASGPGAHRLEDLVALAAEDGTLDGARAPASVSSTTTAAPSDMTKPLRRRSNGREAFSGEG